MPTVSAPAHAGRIALRSLAMARAAIIASLSFVANALLLVGHGREGLQRAFARALVRACSSLGATFIKVGQIASTRADLLPPPIIEELSKLQDRLPPFGDVERIIERELGQPVDRIFAEFDREPVAAASVAQVHRARLRSSEGGEPGAEVAVKVRRPDIVDKVALDRSILLLLARTMEMIVPSLRLISLEEAMRSFCDGVEEQLRLDLEARNNLRFQENFADDDEIVFPRLHERWCSEAVLTMEFIEGIHERDLERAGIDLEQLVMAGMRAVCRMIFLHGFVHADLHPGNLRFEAPCRIVMLDLGLVGSLDERDRLVTAQLLFALATGDGKTVARLFFDEAPHTATADYATYEHEMSELVSSVQAKGLGNLQITLEIGRIFDILRRHRIQARAHMTMVNLALMTAEGLGKRLAPDLALTEAALPFLAEALGVQPPQQS
jgi:ubiquinone biosynthesis protein